MIVVDTTVLADLLFNSGPARAAAVRLLEEDSEWICLNLVLYEVGSVAWKQVKFGGMTPELAQSALAQHEDILVRIEQQITLEEVLLLGLERNLTFYDAAHVWLARSCGLKLRTRDTKILRSCPDIAVAMPS